MASKVEFKVFRDTVENGGLVAGLVVKGGAQIARNQIDHLIDVAKGFGAKGLAWVKIAEGWKLDSAIATFLKAEPFQKALPDTGPVDLMLFVADKPAVTYDVLGRLRLHLGEELNLVDREKWEAKLNRAGIATAEPTFGTRFDSDGSSYQDDWLPGKSTLSLPVGWVMNATDTLVIRGDGSTTTLIGWEVIDDA